MINLKTKELKEGIKLHVINTDRYKTDITCLTLTTSLKRETITKNALIPFMLRRGSTKFPNQYLINKELENMYGSSLTCSLDKTGDNAVLKLYIKSIDNDYALDNENILKMNLECLLDVVFNPIIENGYLKEEFLDIEKENLKMVINSKIDDKDSYAYDSCISSMYNDEGFGLYKYGYVEDLDNIDIKDITEYYRWLINNSRIDIYVSGKKSLDEVTEIIKSCDSINELKSRKPEYILPDLCTNSVQTVDNAKEIIENMDVTQGKLVIGLDITDENKEVPYISLVYNAILGDGANSMMFQNVREKEGLAYSSRSTLVKTKKNIFIRCGIQIENYKKALDLIKVQLENIRTGKFTDTDIENAKIYLISSIKDLEEEQETELIYVMGRQILDSDLSIEEYVNKVNNVTREEIIELANSIKINTIYFLRN